MSKGLAAGAKKLFIHSHVVQIKIQIVFGYTILMESNNLAFSYFFIFPEFLLTFDTFEREHKSVYQ